MRVFAVLLVLVMTACAPRNAPKTAVAAFAPLNWSSLAGAPFTLASLTVKGKKLVLPASRRPTIQFGDNGAVSGMAGVNRYTTAAAVSGKDGIAWTGPVAATKMAGPPEAMALENDFLQALEAVRKIELRDGKLKLASADGAIRMELNR